MARREEQEAGQPLNSDRPETGEDFNLRSRMTRGASRVHHDSPTSKRCRGRHDWRGSPAIPTIVHESGRSTQWPMLTKTNHTKWSSVMMMKLQVRQMWDAVRYGDIDYHEDLRR